MGARGKLKPQPSGDRVMMVITMMMVVMVVLTVMMTMVMMTLVAVVLSNDPTHLQIQPRSTDQRSWGGKHSRNKYLYKTQKKQKKKTSAAQQ